MIQEGFSINETVSYINPKIWSFLGDGGKFGE